MVQAGGSGEALEAARRALAARDADLADADRALTEAISSAHAIAVGAIGRIDAITADVEAVVTGQPKNNAAEAREIGRRLVAKNREIAAVVDEARAAADAKTVVLTQLIERYRPSTSG